MRGTTHQAGGAVGDLRLKRNHGALLCHRSSRRWPNSFDADAGDTSAVLVAGIGRAYEPECCRSRL